MHAAEAQIRAKVRMALADEDAFAVLSSGERIAVALILDRYDLLEQAWGPCSRPSIVSGSNGQTRHCACSVTVGTSLPTARTRDELTTSPRIPVSHHDFQTGHRRWFSRRR